MAMKQYEIWTEGYVVTGQSAGASLMGTAKGKDFEDACLNYFDPHDKEHMRYFDPKRFTYWGCKLFDNQADARKSFG